MSQESDKENMDRNRLAEEYLGKDFKKAFGNTAYLLGRRAYQAGYDKAMERAQGEIESWKNFELTRLGRNISLEAEVKRLTEALNWTRDGLAHFTADEDQEQVSHLQKGIDEALPPRREGP